MHEMTGGCHCGNIAVKLQLTRVPGTYAPRACDCDFCCKHRAAYVSDALGALAIKVKDGRGSGTYRQGSGVAEFLYCKSCGVLIGVLHRSEKRVHAAVNANVMEGRTQFAPEQPVSPKALSGSDKVLRWQDTWFSEVRLVGAIESRRGGS